jgi:hypothetical protein
MGIWSKDGATVWSASGLAEAVLDGESASCIHHCITTLMYRWDLGIHTVGPLGHPDWVSPLIACLFIPLGALGSPNHVGSQGLCVVSSSQQQ